MRILNQGLHNNLFVQLTFFSLIMCDSQCERVKYEDVIFSSQQVSEVQFPWPSLQCGSCVRGQTCRVLNCNLGNLYKVNIS